MAPTIFRFYHDQLPDDEWRDFYCKVEAAVRAFEPTLVTNKVLSKSIDDYYRVLCYVYNDHPELFYFNFYRCRYLITDKKVMIFLNYCETADSMQKKSMVVNQAVDRVLAECFPEGIENVSDLRKEKKIFDWLTDNVTYDFDSLEKYSETMDILYDAWTVYGALILKKAVCQGISGAFKLLCDRLNIPSLVVLGDGGGRHAWNIVRIEGRFYQVDCTWTLKNSINLTIPYKRYEYLNITDEIMNQTHTPDDQFLPKCSSLRHNPYAIKGLCCRNTYELFEMALQHISKGEMRFAFLCLSGYPEQAERQELAERLTSTCGMMVSLYPDKNKYYLGFVVERRS